MEMMSESRKAKLAATLLYCDVLSPPEATLRSCVVADRVIPRGVPMRKSYLHRPDMHKARKLDRAPRRSNSDRDEFAAEQQAIIRRAVSKE
jgi:hypothetical protein